jgi:hypothetical protein
VVNVTPRPRQVDVARDVLVGQVSFAFLIAVCVALHPGLVLKSDEGGMSNYGVHLKTVLPYSLALGLPAVLTYRAQRFLHPKDERTRRLRTLMRVYSVLIALTLLTTYGYTLNSTLKVAHVAVGVAITVFETVASIWFYRTLRQLPLVRGVQLAGAVLAVVTFVGVVHLLFLTQLMTGGAYAVLLVRATRTLAT